MSELDVLRALTGQLRPPDYDDLVALARKRRRRSTTGALVAGAAAAVLTAGIVQAALSGDGRTVEPAPAPSPSPSPIDDATLERIRNEGAPLDLLDGGSGLTAGAGPEVQLYCVGEAPAPDSPCDRYHPYDPREDQAWALEVRQQDQSAFFEIRGTPLVKDFDDDSVLVVDGTGLAPRHRLLQADGTSLELRLVEDRAPAAPGPDVLLIQDLDVYRSGMIGGDGPLEPPYLVDDESATLRPLDVPTDVEWWGPNVDEFLWGGSGCRVTWQQPDGTFAQHDADCRGPQGYTNPGWNAEEATAGWLEPGRMVIVQWGHNGAPKVLHASVDRGVTWERVEVGDRSWGDSVAVINDALADALRELGER
jgi:hypothetical protein